MMANSINFVLALLFGSLCIASAVPRTRIFNYLDDLPIKAESKAESSSSENAEATEVDSGKISEAEQKCWDTINDLSRAIFMRQINVLDKLDKDLEKMNITSDFKSQIQSTTELLRSNMDFALKSLDDGKPDDYFDALFDTSENIITLSSLLRDPDVDDEAFFVLVEAVSRLGRNSSMLVQELTTVCASRMMTKPKGAASLKPATNLPIKDN